jgi:hypothetical protein
MITDQDTISVIYRQLLGNKYPVTTGHPSEIILRFVNVNILEMEDVLFHLNSAVMMPENPQGKSSEQGDAAAEDESLTGIKALAVVFKQFEFDPDKRMIITGHTDTSGTASFNFKLSDERAGNILYLLSGTKELWGENCYRRHKIEDYQQIMKYFAPKLKCGCDPGNIDDTWGDKTKEASRNFFIKMNPLTAEENFKKLNKDSQKRWPQEIWECVYDLYSKEMAEALEITDAELDSRRKNEVKFIDEKKKYLGCGESFPIENKEKNNYRSQKNRRVEILFFDKEEIPDIKCPAVKDRTHKDDECPLWRKFYFKTDYINPGDLKSLVYHLKFFYYDRIKNEMTAVPEGLEVKVFENGGKQLPAQTVYKDCVYFVKVNFGSKIVKPERTEIYFEFETTNLWIYTKDKDTSPEIVTKSPGEVDKLKLKERMQYYDLPVKWTSRKYWTRYNADFFKGDGYEKVFKDKLKLKPPGDKITERDKPLMFCLDDFVLTDSDFRPITQPVGNYNAAILNDTFSVFNPDEDNNKSYYTKRGIRVAAGFQNIRIPSPDTPHRGVILKHLSPTGNAYKLFVIFRDRVPAGHELAGYRAAVYEHKKNCVLVKRFQQRHQRTFKNIGRFDSYLLRSLYVNDKDEEVSYIFNYFRWFLQKPNPPNTASTPLAVLPALSNKAIINFTNEWNKKDDNQLPSLYHKDDSSIYRIYIKYYIEQVPYVDREVAIIVHPAGTAGRSNMGADTGNIREDQIERDAVSKRFVGAHEYGHAASLDDDYIENTSYCSYFRPGFVDFKPGGPFNLDNNSMMKGNIKIRSRQYWHFATWMRREFIKGKELDFSVILKNEKVYKIPFNPNDKFDPRDQAIDSANYVNVPIKQQRNSSNQKSTQPFKGKFHLYLYPLGKDHYSERGLYGANSFSALMVVIVNLYIKSWSGNPTIQNVHDELLKFEEQIKNQFMLANGLKIEGDEPFKETFVQIVPRFCVKYYAPDYDTWFEGYDEDKYKANHDYAIGRNESEKHLIIDIVNGSSSIDLDEDPPELELNNSPAEFARFWRYFSHTLGLGFGETLKENNFGVGDFIPNGKEKSI